MLFLHSEELLHGVEWAWCVVCKAWRSHEGAGYLHGRITTKACHSIFYQSILYSIALYPITSYYSFSKPNNSEYKTSYSSPHT